MLSACAVTPNSPNEKYDAFWRARCKLDVAHSPEIRGLKLGMSVEQVKSRFPALNVPPPGEVGHIFVDVGRKTSTQNINPGIDLEGIELLTFSFLDGHLSDIHIDYAKDSKLKTEEEYTSKISESLNLPSFVGSYVQCFDFEVFAFFDVGLGNSLYLKDVSAEKVYYSRLRARKDREDLQKAERERRESEERKKGFKP